MRVAINQNGTAGFFDDDQLCGIYRHDDPFKSCFSKPYTPGNVQVVDPPPEDPPHHKGLQFGRGSPSGWGRAAIA